MMNIRTTSTSKSSRSHFLLIFAIITALVCTMSAYFITSGYLNAFADDEPATDPEVITPETDPNGDISVTIGSEGEGSLSPAGETISVPSGTVYSIYGNELTIADKKYTANVNEGYWFSGWFLGDQYMDIYGTINEACTITAKFTTDANSCIVRGTVIKEGSPAYDATIRVVSEDYPTILVSTSTDHDGKFSIKVPRSIAFDVCAYSNRFVGYAPVTAEQTSGESFDISQPIEIKFDDPEHCLLTGTISAGPVVKDAAIVYLWDEHSSGSYDFHNNLVYSNNLGAFYCLGKHATNAYILYFAPGIRMSVRRVSASETMHAQAVMSYNVKKEGVPVYISCPNGVNYSYELNLATLDCADVINYDFNNTINLGLDKGISVKFSGDTFTYNMQDDVNPWRSDNGINIKYSITAKPNNSGVQFKQWRVNGQPIVDGSVIQIDDTTQISADVEAPETIDGLVWSNLEGAGLSGTDVFFVNKEETQTYAHSVSDNDGKFTWNLPEGISGKVIALHENYLRYEKDYTSQAGELKIEMEVDPEVDRYYIKGRITEDDKFTPISGALVSFYNDDGTRSHSVLTGYDGSYYIDLKDHKDNGILVVYKDYYVPAFISCEWNSNEVAGLNKDASLRLYTQAKATYFGMSEFQSAYNLSLFYKGKRVYEEKHVEPFVLYFNDFSINDDADVLYINDINGAESGFSYEVTSEAINSNYIFKNWDIKVPNNENAIFESTDIMPIYEYTGDNPEPGVITKTGDATFYIIAGIIGIIIASGTIMFVSRRSKSKEKD